MKSTNQVQKKIHPLIAIAPLAGGLTCAVVAFAAVAWWVGTPPQAAEPLPAMTMRTPALTPESAPSTAAAPPSETTPEAEPSVEGSTAPATTPTVRVALEGGAAEEDHLERALTALETGDPSQALEALRHHLHHNPATPDVLIRVGRLARELDRVPLAGAALAEARRLAPEETEVDIEEARLFLGTGEAVKAREAASRAVRRSPEESLTWNLLGRAEMAASRWEAAEIAFAQALDLDPANPWIHNNRGLLRVYRREGGAAADDLATAVALFGEDVPHHVHNNLGLALELEGRFEEARAAFEDALAVSPFYVKARVNLRRVDESIEKALVAAERRVADGSVSAAMASPVLEAESDEEEGETPEASEVATAPEFDELPEGLELWED